MEQNRTNAKQNPNSGANLNHTRQTGFVSCQPTSAVLTLIRVCRLKKQQMLMLNLDKTLQS